MSVKRSLIELKARASPVFTRPEVRDLVAIAAESSPNAASELARNLTDDEKIAKACRWLSVIRRDFGIEIFQGFVESKTNHSS